MCNDQVITIITNGTSKPGFYADIEGHLAKMHIGVIKLKNPPIIMFKSVSNFNSLLFKLSVSNYK